MQPKWLSLLKVQVDPLYAMVEIWLSNDNHQHTVWTAPYCMVSFIMSIRGLKWKLELKNISLMHLNVLLQDEQYKKLVLKPSYKHFLWYSWLQQSCADVD